MKVELKIFLRIIMKTNFGKKRLKIGKKEKSYIKNIRREKILILILKIMAKIKNQVQDSIRAFR
jgi:hypothetical protein